MPSLCEQLRVVKTIGTVRIVPTADIGPTGRRVAERVREARGRVPLRELSDKLAGVGRPILASGIHKIERAERRVDVDDLVALALVLGRTPNQLLIPPVSGHEDQEVDWTPDVRMELGAAWRWANGFIPRPDVHPIRREHMTSEEGVRWADDLRRITEAIREAAANGVPIGNLYNWMEATLLILAEESDSTDPLGESDQ